MVNGNDVTTASKEQAAQDLERIFNLGGVAALVGYWYLPGPATRADRT